MGSTIGVPFSLFLLMASDASETFDVIVLGAGAGGMAAACVAAAEGCTVLLLEKADRAGGTTAVSGGMLWIPAHRRPRTDGQVDAPDAARLYLRHTVPGEFNEPLRETYLEHAARAIEYFEARTEVHFRPVAFYPDYYPDLPGATLGSRVLEPMAIDARALGPHFRLLRPPLPEFTLFGGMMVDRADIPHFRKLTRSARSGVRVARVVGRYLWDRLFFERGAHLVLGNALAARLLKSALMLGVQLRLATTVVSLTWDGARVGGVTLADGGRIRARKGVVLATGGFSRDPALRARYFPPNAGPLSAGCQTNTGDGLRLGMEAGAHITEGNSNNAYWVPVSRFQRADGSEAVFPHTVTDRGKPGLIAVNGAGQRFVNEATSYHEFVQAMLRQDAIPAWLICDRACLWRYGLGAIRPFTRSVSAWRTSGYLKSAPTLAALAPQLRLDARALEATVARYNANAKSGTDPDFGKGSNAYHKYVGDPEHQPNPCVAPLRTPPFFAVAVYPGDLGTSAGLQTNADAQVLDTDARPILGLYACGNDMGSIMNGAYPGPGITLGPALTFGYLAARHLASS